MPKINYLLLLKRDEGNALISSSSSPSSSCAFAVLRVRRRVEVSPDGISVRARAAIPSHVTQSHRHLAIDHGRDLVLLLLLVCAAHASWNCRTFDIDTTNAHTKMPIFHPSVAVVPWHDSTESNVHTQTNTRARHQLWEPCVIGTAREWDTCFGFLITPQQQCAPNYSMAHRWRCTVYVFFFFARAHLPLASFHLFSFHKSISIAFTGHCCRRRRALFVTGKRRPTDYTNTAMCAHYEHVSCILIYSFCCHRASSAYTPSATESSSPTHRHRICSVQPSSEPSELRQKKRSKLQGTAGVAAAAAATAVILLSSFARESVHCPRCGAADMARDRGRRRK